jgi:acetyl-CoA carboxylase biotin carboxyl carrier protein
VSDDDPLLAYTGLSQRDLTDVLAMLSGTDVLELDLAVGDAHLRLRRPASPASAQSGPATAAEPEPASLAITSPLVGVFHPAVEAGQQVQAGQSIGAIEALGLPTTVDAPQAGSVEQLLVADGLAVEYGQPLLVLRRA